jgi:glutaredoxin
MNCPKCAYTRKASDAATPDWQCPSCGVAYAKVVNAPSPPPRHAAPAKPAPGRARPLVKLVFVLLLLGGIGAFYFGPGADRGESTMAAPAAVAPTPSYANKAAEIDWKRSYIVMYSLTTCGFCVQKRQEFHANGIPFVEYFMDTDPAREDEFMAKLVAQGFQSGYFGTPSFDVNGKMMVNNPSTDDILKQASL